ncbi:MAG: 1,6-dihydroxycyclohexa-2,4-diene-1-carboxylate dehydrogenase [Crocinitomicaceae bacterium]|nr:1,6-dihydroxycyclohexa-2,4-diene-1-carboxylate dehydrogenase [Crocinitomicaceae bacterium]|tara:strand:- start:1160 stop:1945 length:786 start_codon:yes stop_codon:yes gene_type:complete
MIFENRFQNKTVVVTGAAQGIGKETALRVAREGAAVAMIDRSPYVKDVAKIAKDEGLEAIALLADLETFDGFKTALKEVQEAFGKIDVLINNVGGTIYTKPYDVYTPDEIESEINRSLYTTLWGCRAVLPHLLSNNGGVIINISSIATRSIRRVPYAAAKGGVNAMTASLAFEYAPHNIRVVGVATGGTEAPPRLVPRHPSEESEQEKAWYQEIIDQTIESTLMKRYGTLEEQVAPILFMASDEASYITGVTLPVSGGDLG